MPSHIFALLTCFNRKEKTLACLLALAKSAAQAGVILRAILVDDGSSDGTADAVRVQFPWVTVHVARGDLYWCRGMHLAFDMASRYNPDYYLWVNDDTVVELDAISRLISVAEVRDSASHAPCIVAGSCRSGSDGLHTYGGVKLASRWIRTRFSKVSPTEYIEPIDTFDGNLVLINRLASQACGNLDPAFEHAMGDYDYGLRAKYRGVECWLAPGWLAKCEQNPRTGTFRDAELRLSKRLHLMFDRKGLPLRSWWRFNRMHGGSLWLVTFLWPYFRVTLESLNSGLRNRFQ